jgi:hypothetical protein
MDILINKFKKLNIDDNIIKIQKIIRGHLIRKYIQIPSSKYQTKRWRMKQLWYINGKKNECEIYQIKIINKIIKNKLDKTFDRINFEDYKIYDKKNPYKFNDGFNYTENFDGLCKNNKYYFNLKFVCDAGGAQTRTLILVYHFIIYQLEYLKTNKSINIYFINILDGDTSYNYLNKFNYLLNKDEYQNIKKYIFVGDTFNFQKYWNSLIK